MLLVLVIVFLVLLVATVPIAFTVGLASVAALAYNGQTPLIVIIQRMMGGADSFTLLAVPFYVFAGALMDIGGISARLVSLARALVGHFKGGMAMVAVVAEYFFSGISGSTVADVSAIGSMLLPALRRTGYSDHNSVAVVSAACAMGSLVPPSVAMIILADAAGLPVGALFMAGFVPAIVLAITLMGLIYAHASRTNLATVPRASLGELLRAIGGGITPAIMPVIIFGGILGGITTATEAGAVAVVYGLIVGVLVYREIKWRQLVKLLIDSAVLTGSLIFLLGTTSAFAWIITTQQVPVAIGNFIFSISTAPWVFLGLSIVVYLLIGTVMDVPPAIVILVPILHPLAIKLGINPLHFALVTYATLMLGAFTPPVGVGLLTACAMAGVKVEHAFRSFLPYLIALIVGILVIAFVPWFTLVLPRLFGLFD